ncbi:hypothetical protein L1049_007682 [Liquidambar formosana]|uniref:Subtilisin-like protease fibronectin type-III domain-containing protein n=1 Tax=Liquidambar formosana TaxID=63359 RepID=A0AAP0S338_LIQFO
MKISGKVLVFVFNLHLVATLIHGANKNENERKGISINTFSPRKHMYSLTNGAHAANGTDTFGNISACDSGTLSEKKVKGKLVYCLGNSGQDYTIDELGGAGTIIGLDEETDVAFPFLIPGTFVSPKDGKKIDQYINSTNSYIRFLCKEGYNSTTIALLTGGKHRYSCSNFKPAQGTDGLNYPSMHIQHKNPNSSISAVFYRTVTHVGHGSKSVFKATVTSPKGLYVKVIPDTLSFHRLYQKKSFKVVLKGSSSLGGTRILSALLEWSNSRHSVKSPILVYRPST